MKKIKFLFLSVIAVTAMTVFNSCSDNCKDVNCQNGGTCDEDDGTCICATGYEGVECETKMRSKFIGQFQGNETCTVGSDSYVITIAESSSNILNITISNVYNQSFTASATLSGSNSFNMGSQSVAAGVTVSGNGTLSGNSLTFSYDIDDGTLQNSCTFVGNKL